MVVAEAATTEKKIALTQDAVKPAAPQSQPQKAAPETGGDSAIEETPEGEKLNVVLAYEPADIKHLNSTTFDVYLVNDSTIISTSHISHALMNPPAGPPAMPESSNLTSRCSLKRSPEPTSLRWTASLYPDDSLQV